MPARALPLRPILAPMAANSHTSLVVGRSVRTTIWPTKPQSTGLPSSGLRSYHATVRRQASAPAPPSSQPLPPAQGDSSWSSRRRTFGSFGFYLFTLATWVPLVILFNDHVLELTWIDGRSMYPFFNPERDVTTRRDVVLTWKYAAPYDLQRGMIVTFWNPFKPERKAVKRIIGLEGDIVQTRAPYPVSCVRVPPGHVWVEGDGLPRDSLDSNTYGPIAAGLITGKVSWLVYPWHRSGRVKWSDEVEKFRRHQ